MRIGGVLFFEVDGKQYSVRGNVTYSTGTSEKESIVGQTGYQGYKETPVAPFIQMDVTEVSGDAAKVLEDARGVRCTLGLANSKTMTLTNATQVNQVEVDAIEGQFTIRFEGEQGYID